MPSAAMKRCNDGVEMLSLVPIGMTPIPGSTAVRPFAIGLFTLGVVLAVAESKDLIAQSQPAAPQPAMSASDSGETGAALQPVAPEEAVDRQYEPGEVVIDGRKILSVYQSIGSITAKDRAE